jgi:hypothetical protein
MSGKSEGDAFKAVDDALSGLEKDAQQRLLDWAAAKFGGNSTSKPTSPSSVPAQKAAKSKASSGGKKTKLVIKIMKDLDLRPKGKISAIDFAKQKLPTNLKQKCVVGVYYLSRTLETERVSVDHVYTFFKELQWPVPPDLPNTLHQAGSEGWLDTSSADDLKLTLRGENLVEHELPASKGKD